MLALNKERRGGGDHLAVARVTWSDEELADGVRRAHASVALRKERSLSGAAALVDGDG